jgi:hypothetical protein
VGKFRISVVWWNQYLSDALNIEHKYLKVIFEGPKWHLLKKVTHKRKPGIAKIILPPNSISAEELLVIARKVKYVPNQKHKRYPIPGQEPYHDHNSAKCDNEITMEQAEKWLKEGILKGAISQFRQNLPSIVWFKHDKKVYEAKLSTSSGEYHGFPLEEYEWPKAIETYFK